MLVEGDEPLLPSVRPELMAEASRAQKPLLPPVVAPIWTRARRFRGRWSQQSLLWRIKRKLRQKASADGVASLENIRDRFTRLDSAGANALDYDKAELLIGWALDMDLSRPEWAALLESLDSEGDGTVSWAGIQHWFADLRQGEVAAPKWLLTWWRRVLRREPEGAMDHGKDGALVGAPGGGHAAERASRPCFVLHGLEGIRSYVLFVAALYYFLSVPYQVCEGRPDQDFVDPS